MSSALILGGGLAGIAAAVRLAQWDVKVTLVETSRRLGGRASSHEDPASGEMVDNCQHVVMGCCTNLLDLYKRLGVSGKIEWHRDLHFFDKQGHHDVLRDGFLPAPFHLSLSMLRFTTFSFAEKKAIARAMMTMLRMGRDGRAETEGITFTDWLRRQHQPQTVIDKFWSVIIVSALNQWPQDASAAAAIHVFQDGFLPHRDAYAMGTASVPLRQLYDPAVGIIERAGGRVLLGTSVAKLLHEDGHIAGVETDSGVLSADCVISTLPFDRLEKITDDALRKADARLQNLDRFTHSPILGIHLVFDRPVVQWPHMIFVDSPLQWVFNKAGTGHDEAATQQYLHGVISAADAWMDKTSDQIVKMAVDELSQYVPGVKDAVLVRGKAVKEKRATFAPAPGIEKFRPATSGTVPNLLLAGDWVATGWPATMEGAVRSGYSAAAVVLNDPSGLVPDLPRATLARWLGS